MVAITTSVGTGSEVTAFAVITDETTGIKYPLADYELTPDMAIVDAELMISMTKSLTASFGNDALTHTLEAYVSVLASEFTNGMALKAINNIFEYLPRVYSKGLEGVDTRKKTAHVSTITGMAFANAFLGLSFNGL